jgi:hypothetical protein
VDLLRSPFAVIQLQVEHNAFDRSAAKLSMSLGQRDNAPLRMVGLRASPLLPFVSDR